MLRAHPTDVKRAFPALTQNRRALPGNRPPDSIFSYLGSFFFVLLFCPWQAPRQSSGFTRVTTLRENPMPKGAQLFSLTVFGGSLFFPPPTLLLLFSLVCQVTRDIPGSRRFSRDGLYALKSWHTAWYTTAYLRPNGENPCNFPGCGCLRYSPSISLSQKPRSHACSTRGAEVARKRIWP
jgi:hypothetical protein